LDLPCDTRSRAVSIDGSTGEVSRPSCACGVGKSFATAEGSIRSPLEPRWFGPPFVPPFVPSVARGVGNSDDETPIAAMASADLVSPQHSPAEPIPESGQHIRDSFKFPSGNDSSHVLQCNNSGS